MIRPTTKRPSRALAFACALGMALPALPAQALMLDFAAPATATGERREALTSYRIPVGPWAAGSIPTELAEGAFDQTAWRIAAPGQTTLQLLRPLRAQLAKAGFDTIFECETAACGGFDFRYGTEVLPEPEMHVDLGDFRFLAARRDGADGPDYVTLLVSRSADTGFVQLTAIGAPGIGTPDLVTSTKSALSTPATPLIPAAPAPAPALAPAASDLGLALAAGTPVILPGLTFASGKADLAPGDYPALADLAAWLAANPDARIDLTGHSDGSGDPVTNTALSSKRAEAIRAKLITSHGIAADRITTRGLGPALPIASNDTAEGRAQNRRVEVTLTPTR